jgi:hypothetical protein
MVNMELFTTMEKLMGAQNHNVRAASIKAVSILAKKSK